ncbi:MAG TPA: hypothetical protein VK489_10485 [Ferruginibacter sp.]|nr:hypothetical protein [Ferruginibacter sp.]
MANNQDNANDIPWRNRIALLENIPGEEGYDTEAGWDTFRQRITRQEPRKKIFPYIAAACLLVLIIMPWVLKENKTTIAPVSSVAVKNDGIAQGGPSVVSIKVSPVVKRKKDIRRIKKYPVPLPGEVQIILTHVPDIIPPQYSAVTNSIPVANAPKKLAIVHINDYRNLEEPVASRNLPGPVRRMIRRKGSDLSLSAPGKQVTGEHILILNIPPQN